MIPINQDSKMVSKFDLKNMAERQTGAREYMNASASAVGVGLATAVNVGGMKLEQTESGKELPKQLLS